MQQLEKRDWGAILWIDGGSQYRRGAWTYRDGSSAKAAQMDARLFYWDTVKIAPHRSEILFVLVSISVALLILIAYRHLLWALLVALVVGGGLWLWTRRYSNDVVGPVPIEETTNLILKTELDFPNINYFTSRVIRQHLLNPLSDRLSRATHALVQRFDDVAQQAARITGPGRADVEVALHALAESYNGDADTSSGILSALGTLSTSIDKTLAAERAMRAAIEAPVRQAETQRRVDKMRDAHNEAHLLIQQAVNRLDLDTEATNATSKLLDGDSR